YLTNDLRLGHAATCLGRNQLMPGSINLSLLYVGHTNDLHINTACGPPRTFNTSSHALLLRTCWFPYGFPLRLTFANRINSLARSSKRTLRHWQPYPYYRLATGSFIRKILSCRNSRSPTNFRHFLPPFQGYFSAFAHATISLSVS